MTATASSGSVSPGSSTMTRASPERCSVGSATPSTSTRRRSTSRVRSSTSSSRSVASVGLRLEDDLGPAPQVQSELDRTQERRRDGRAEQRPRPGRCATAATRGDPCWGCCLERDARSWPSGRSVPPPRGGLDQVWSQAERVAGGPRGASTQRARRAGRGDGGDDAMDVTGWSEVVHEVGAEPTRGGVSGGPVGRSRHRPPGATSRGWGRRRPARRGSRPANRPWSGGPAAEPSSRTGPGPASDASPSSTTATTHGHQRRRWCRACAEVGRAVPIGGGEDAERTLPEV